MIKVFIAGPYSNGDVAKNVKESMDMANKLINLGYAPFCPHLTHFLHMNNWQPYEKWLEIDAAFLRNCDAVIRIPGESYGADQEVKLAKRLGIPVYEELNKLSIELAQSSQINV